MIYSKMIQKGVLVKCKIEQFLWVGTCGWGKVKGEGEGR
jgi:hypothetical protein